MTTSPPPTTTSTHMSASESARLGAEAAGRSALAVAKAAENAQKPGNKSSEMKVTIASIAVAGLLGGLQALSVVPGPWQIFALVTVGVIGGAAAYANSRGKVKAAALAAAALAGNTSGPVIFPTT